jgi:hypothetical protein
MMEKGSFKGHMIMRRGDERSFGDHVIGKGVTRKFSDHVVTRRGDIKALAAT